MLYKKWCIFIVVLTLIIIAYLLFSCKTMSQIVQPVSNFQADRYLGTWYEIARFDFKFEKNLNNVTAEYSMNPDGSIKVINSGYNYKKQKWVNAIGKAKFQKEQNNGALKVSFFGPFYSEYNIIALDDNYTSALVVGKNYNYLWILSRTPEISDFTLTKFLTMAKSLGFDLNKLIWVQHDKNK